MARRNLLGDGQKLHSKAYTVILSQTLVNVQRFR